MATKLSPDKSITREIQLRILPEPINVTVNCFGLRITAKGCRKPVCISWDMILNRASTPSNVPAKFYGRALEYLRSQMRPATIVGRTILAKSQTQGYIGAIGHLNDLPRN